MSQGNWDYLVEEKKKKDREVDEKLRQEEEALRKRQEVSHMHVMTSFSEHPLSAYGASI